MDLTSIYALWGVGPEQWNDWRWQIGSGPTKIGELARFVDLSGVEIAELQRVIDRFPMCITPYYLSLAGSRLRDDPIMLQCIPQAEELREGPQCGDPFAETEHMPVRGVIHRYRDRVVILVCASCAVYCRHCTRKNALGSDVFIRDAGDLDAASRYVAGTPGVREVIVSGGDPLLLDAVTVDAVLAAFSKIDHVEALRVGTRLPVTLPMRIDDELCDVLARHRPLWVNTHFNHPREVTPQSMDACERMLCRGIPVSNQAVLLRGVNDDIGVMRELCVRLQRNMVRPYYVFQCDPVAGAHHFTVPEREGMEMEQELRNSVGGLAVPRFVVDMPGTRGKMPLGGLPESRVGVVKITEFQACVYAATQRIPRGRVTSYKLLAEAVGCASARAVGQALKCNPFAPEVPCHRVIAHDMTPGGFQGAAGGAAIKRKLALLAKEGVLFLGGRLADRRGLYTFGSDL